jgi:hypothetical protein
MAFDSTTKDQSHTDMQTTKINRSGHASASAARSLFEKNRKIGLSDLCKNGSIRTAVDFLQPQDPDSVLKEIIMCSVCCQAQPNW